MLLLVGPAQGWISAWSPRLRAAGWPLQQLSTLTAAHGRVRAELALVDLGSLPGDVTKALGTFRRASPDCRVALVAAPEALVGDLGRAGMSSGADDFLLADLAPVTAVERVRRLLELGRRGGSPASADGAVRLDESRRVLWLKPGKAAVRQGPALTPREFELLRLLLKADGVPLSRALLLDALCGRRADDVTPGVVDRHVAALRRKLGRLGARIRTLRGKGYLFAND